MKKSELLELIKDAPMDTELNFFLIPNDGSEEDVDEKDLPLENLSIVWSGGLDLDEPQLDLGIQFPKATDNERKVEIISNIKKVVSQYGGFSVADVDGEQSPLIDSMGKDNHILAERFGLDTVTGVTYVHETETDSNEFDYSDLDLDTLEDILSLVDHWEDEQERTEKKM